jgi:hypothetical protein
LKPKNVKKLANVEPTFDDVKRWHDENMHPSKMNFDDPKPYEVYENARWAGIFQCVDSKTPIMLADGTQKLIDQVNVGDEVKTYDVLARQFTSSTVDQIYDQGIRECVELLWDDGRTLTVTADHLILTARGWVHASELTIEDVVVSFNTQR